MEQLEQQFHFEKPRQDYLRVMTASPEVAVGDPEANVQRILPFYQDAVANQAALVSFPELSVTGYTAADLFHNRYLLEKSDKALVELAETTRTHSTAMIVGAPLEVGGILYNCGVMLANGEIIGAVPKSWLPNYNEFYEQRWFASGRGIRGETAKIDGQEFPFGTDLIFEVGNTKVGIEICEDAFAPIPPSAGLALGGAEVIVNLSASDELIGKDDYRRRLVTGHAANLICAYVYASAGEGESNADVVYGGHQIISELGKLVAEAKPLTDTKSLVYDIDREYIAHDRMRNTTFRDQALEQQQNKKYETVKVKTNPGGADDLRRKVETGFKPKSQEALDERCRYIFDMTANALARSVQEGRTHGLVMGLSGGLDSTHALLIADHARKLLGKPADFIHTVTLPAQASSERTQGNAAKLAEALGTTHKTMPIGELANSALAAIGHDQQTEDIAFENTQARMRTLLLMNYANSIRGMVVGTGDMSENAQGWCTFNGDHMSMYNPNAGIPKTLVRDLVRWYAETYCDEPTKKILQDILDTPVSPELTGNGDLSQETESVIGPYELHDFFLNEMQRYGSRPDKIAYLASLAFEGQYDKPEITKWLGSFLVRFTGSQWKRETMPNGPKIGTVSLSPRGDWRMAPNTSQGWHK